MARILPIFIPHLGCPCQCVFCNQRTIAAERPATPETVESQIREDLARIGGQTAQVAFYGGSFTAIPDKEQEALLQAVQPFLKKGAISSIRLSTRPDAIDHKVLTRLRWYGVDTIELGAQSMSDEVLVLSKRGHKAEDTVCASRMIKESGFHLILQLMIGLPGDTREQCRDSAQKAAELNPDGVRLYPVAVLPGTELCRQYREGAYSPLGIEEAAEWCADLLDIFILAGIPIIRLGLNPTEELDRKIIAGAYHPALGELCYGEWFYRRMRRMVTGQDKTVLFFVHPSDISKAIGQKRRNLLRLQAEFPHCTFQVQAGHVPKNSLERRD